MGSPTLFKATSENDLYRWWKATADPNFIGFGHSQKLHNDDGVDIDVDVDVEDSSGTPSTAIRNDDASSDELIPGWRWVKDKLANVRFFQKSNTMAATTTNVGT